MSGPLTPIEGMPGWIIIRCPKCKRTKSVGRMKTDPENAAVVEAECNRHPRALRKDTIAWFDAQGRQIDIDGIAKATAAPLSLRQIIRPRERDEG